MTDSVAIKVKKVPELRFREFKDEWSKRPLSEMADKSTAKNKNNHYTNVLTNSATKGIVKQEDYFDREIVSEENLNGYYIVKTNDFVYNPRTSVTAPVGPINCNYIEPGIMSPLYTVFRFNNGDINFLAFYFKTSKWHKYLRAVSNIGARHDRMNITDNAFFNLPIHLPSLPEQQKIAFFLSAVDRKIELLRRKKEALEQYKKGVMQKLFSQEIRFKQEDGTEFPEWEEKKLQNVLEQQIREVEKPLDDYLAIGVRSHVKGTFQKPNSDPDKIAMDKLFVVRENDLIVNITFAWEGAIAIVKDIDDGGLVSHRFPTYTFKKGKTIYSYFNQLIHNKKFTRILELISPGGAGRNRVLSKKEFLKIKWKFPCVEEQEKIADFLSNIDNKIESVDTQLDQTQTFKKGLLQQMFV